MPGLQGLQDLQDPSRGCRACRYDHPVGDIIDVHDYVEPRSPGARYNRAAVLGEYGGLGYKVHPCACCCMQATDSGARSSAGGCTTQCMLLSRHQHAVLCRLAQAMPHPECGVVVPEPTRSLS